MSLVAEKHNDAMDDDQGGGYLEGYDLLLHFEWFAEILYRMTGGGNGIHLHRYSGIERVRNNIMHTLSKLPANTKFRPPESFDVRVGNGTDDGELVLKIKVCSTDDLALMGYTIDGLEWLEIGSGPENLIPGSILLDFDIDDASLVEVEINLGCDNAHELDASKIQNAIDTLVSDTGEIKERAQTQITVWTMVKNSLKECRILENLFGAYTVDKPLDDLLRAAKSGWYVSLFGTRFVPSS